MFSFSIVLYINPQTNLSIVRWCSCEGMLLRDSSTRSLLQKHHLSTPKQGTSHVDKIIVKSYLKRNDRKLVSKKHQQKPFLQGSAHGMGWDYLCYGFARRWNQVLLLEIHGESWSPMISVQYTYLSATSYHAIPLFAAVSRFLFQHHTDTISKSRADSAVVMWSVLF